MVAFLQGLRSPSKNAIRKRTSVKPPAVKLSQPLSGGVKIFWSVYGNCVDLNRERSLDMILRNDFARIIDVKTNLSKPLNKHLEAAKPLLNSAIYQFNMPDVEFEFTPTNKQSPRLYMEERISAGIDDRTILEEGLSKFPAIERLELVKALNDAKRSLYGSNPVSDDLKYELDLWDDLE